MKRHIDYFTKAVIDAHLGAALGRLTELDAVLFHLDANERSLSFRLAHYLACEFPDFDVDCEYNRHHRDEKHRKRLHDPDLLRLAGREPSLEDEEGLTVFPDIIIHRRETDDNLLVIEIKKSSSTIKEAFDLAKLKAYREELGYRFAKFIRLGTKGEKPSVVVNQFV
jgi:hypothetical protein